MTIMTERLGIAQAVVGCKVDNQGTGTGTGTQFLAGTNISLFFTPSISTMGPKHFLFSKYRKTFHQWVKQPWHEVDHYTISISKVNNTGS
jgi:hypothetical protein